MTDFLALPDLACSVLGGRVVHTNDEFFGGAHHLLRPDAATHDPTAWSPRGKIYDGWETRRRRDRGTDSVIVRLAAPAVVRGVVVDTAHFRGNYPPSASVEATTALGYPSVPELLAAPWYPLVERTGLDGDCANQLPVSSASPDRLVTHVRLRLHPDGGVARFRVHGEVVPDPRRLGGRVDLASVLHGGAVRACSNMFFSSPANVLRPSTPVAMYDGWETARRRDAGNDWLVVRLGVPGVARHVVLDTSHFVGNSPDSARLSDQDTGTELMPPTRLQPDTEHFLRVRADSVLRSVRLDVYPDGGLARLRVFGEVPEAAREEIAARWLGLLPTEAATSVDRAEFFA
ncbi:MAG: allantoicase [Pseudonocardia sp.]|nr:allantoicase [Pseudonocardia sp.]